MFTKFRQKRITKAVQKAHLDAADWEQLKQAIKIENQIAEEKDALNNRKEEQEKVSWSKKFLIFLFVNFSIIEIFTGFVTFSSFVLAYKTGISPDLTPLITLIGAVIGETLSYGIYAAKSKAENTEGGIVFEQHMEQLRQQYEEDNE